MKIPRSLKRLGSSLLIGGQAIAATMRCRVNIVELSDQLLETGPGSLLIVLIISLAVGSVFNIQVAAELTRQGAASTIGGILAIGLAREIAPLLTACLLAGKVATAYAAQLGAMKVTEQIDAITMLRTDPVEYLVVPRLIALVVMAPLQCFFFFIVAIWSGHITSTAVYSIPPTVFWTSVRTWIDLQDLLLMLVKATVFGLIIAIIACGWGLTTEGGPKEVGTSTTGAVVTILVLVCIMDVVLTQVLFSA
ncbi:ABC transporter permease [Synechococcus sp. M16CYN]|uniref:MlaE family ABC transporter permease n=1 Tax=Synechococcus sp. M16CYN TaxID=3103139 RepID=UPI00324BF3A7